MARVITAEVLIECNACGETKKRRGAYPVAPDPQRHRNQSSHLEEARQALLNAIDQAVSIVVYIGESGLAVRIAKTQARRAAEESTELLSLMQDYEVSSHLVLIERGRRHPPEVVIADSEGRSLFAVELPECGHCDEPIVGVSYRCPRPAHRDIDCHNHFHCVYMGMVALGTDQPDVVERVDTEHCDSCGSPNVDDSWAVEWEGGKYGLSTPTGASLPKKR